MKLRKNNLSIFLFYIVFLIFSIFILTINIIEMKKDDILMNLEYEPYEMSASAIEILGNILGDPIESLSPMRDTLNCSPGSKKLKIFSLKTTEFWCECPDLISPGRCSEATHSLCKTHTQAEFEGYKWKGTEVCAKLIPRNDWTFPTFGPSTECTDDEFYYCASSHICVKDQRECPLTDIKFVKKELVDNVIRESNQSFFKSNIVMENNNYEIIMSNSGRNKGALLKIFASSRVSDCVSPERRPGNMNSDYDIYLPRRVGCGKYGEKDDIQTLIDSYKEKDFLSENGFSGEEYRNFYYAGDKNKINLIYEKKIPLNYKEKLCMEIDFNGLMENSYNISQFTSVRMGANIVAVIFCCGKLVFLILFFFFNFLTSKVHHIILLTNIIFGFFVVNATTQLILCSLSIIHGGKVSKNISTFDKMAKLGCITSDSYNEIFKDIRLYLSHQFEANLYYAKLNLISASVCIFFSLLVLILWARKRTKYQKIEGEKELLLDY